MIPLVLYQYYDPLTLTKRKDIKIGSLSQLAEDIQYLPRKLTIVQLPALTFFSLILIEKEEVVSVRKKGMNVTTEFR